MAKREDTQTTADLELRALQRMIAARSRQIRHFAEQLRTRGLEASREDELQLEAFLERSSAAMAQAEADTGEPKEMRISRLEGLAKALECSWQYFEPRANSAPGKPDSRWGVRLK